MLCGVQTDRQNAPLVYLVKAQIAVLGTAICNTYSEVPA